MENVLPSFPSCVVIQECGVSVNGEKEKEVPRMGVTDELLSLVSALTLLLSLVFLCMLAGILGFGIYILRNVSMVDSLMPWTSLAENRMLCTPMFLPACFYQLPNIGSRARGQSDAHVKKRD